MTEIDEGTKTGWTEVHAAFMGYCLTRTGAGRSSDPLNVKHNMKPNRQRLATRCGVELADVKSLETPVPTDLPGHVATGLLTSVVTTGLGWPSLEDWFAAAQTWAEAGR